MSLPRNPLECALSALRVGTVLTLPEQPLYMAPQSPAGCLWHNPRREVGEEVGEPLPPVLPIIRCFVLWLGGYLSICKLIQRYAECSGKASQIGA